VGPPRFILLTAPSASAIPRLVVGSKGERQQGAISKPRSRFVAQYEKGPAGDGGAELSGRLMKRKKQPDETSGGSRSKEKNIVRISKKK
jgi:hypothetical protein